MKAKSSKRKSQAWKKFGCSHNQPQAANTYSKAQACCVYECHQLRQAPGSCYLSSLPSVICLRPANNGAHPRGSQLGSYCQTLYCDIGKESSGRRTAKSGKSKSRTSMTSPAMVRTPDHWCPLLHYCAAFARGGDGDGELGWCGGAHAQAR